MVCSFGLLFAEEQGITEQSSQEKVEEIKSQLAQKIKEDDEEEAENLEESWGASRGEIPFEEGDLLPDTEDEFSLEADVVGPPSMQIADFPKETSGSSHWTTSHPQEEIPLPVQIRASEPQESQEGGETQKEGQQSQKRRKIKPSLNRAAPEVMEILERGVLRVGMCTIDQPPFHEMGRNGEFIGIDIDLARELGEALGVQVKFVKAPDWAGTVELLLDGKIDIILSNLTLLPERTARIYCSKPYSKIRQCILLNRVLLTRAYGKGQTTLRELFSEGENRNLIIQEGTAYATSVLSMFPKAKVTITASWDEIMDKIIKRECIGTISDELEIKKRTRAVQTMELLPVVIKGMYDSMVIGVSHKAPHLLHFINSFIDYNNINFSVENFDYKAGSL